MTKIIEAKAVISAADQTGKTFDNVAKKIDSIAKSAKAFEGMKPFQKTGWGQGFDKELDRLKASAAELQVLQKSWESFHNTLGRGGPMAASKAIGAMDFWKRQTLANLREVKAATEQTEASHGRYLRNIGKYALAAGGISFGAYEVGRGVRSGVRSAAERQRELTRYGLAGLSAAEQNAAMARADEVSARNPSIGRTDVLEHIRQLRARLGSFDHAIDSVEDVTRAQTVLRTLGHGESSGEDLEKLVLGLESQGLGSNPEKFRSFLSAFVKAKSLFPDLRGEDFRQYMQRAAASKYGLSDDYLKNVVPTLMQHEGASNFGTMQSSAFSALIGGRQTKEAKAAMQRFGLMGNGTIVDEKGFVANPYDWAVKRLQPALAKRGISMDEEHRGDVVEAVTKMFSNRKVGEFFASMLVNQGIVDKDRLNLASAKGVEGADSARQGDPFIASGAFVTQLKDAGTALIKLQPLVDSLNFLTEKIAKGTSAFDQADTSRKAGYLVGGGLGAGAIGVGGLMGARAAYQWFTGGAALTTSAAQLSAAAVALDGAAARLASGGLLGAGTKVAGATAAAGGAASAGIIGGIGAVSMLAPAAAMYWHYQDDKAHPKRTPADILTYGGDPGLAYAAQYAAANGADDGDFTLGSNGHIRKGNPGPSFRRFTPTMGSDGVPMPQEGFGNVRQVPVTVSGELHGQADLTIKIEPSSEFFRAIADLKQSIKLAGSINGPGSNGRTSPDAQPGAGGRGLSAMPY